MSITWFDYDDESERDIANKVMAFTRKYDFYSEFSDEDISEEELFDTYRLILTYWKEACLREDK